jgi:3-hydroxyisobutyrate dehydrogenase-like beta-hydroxyacid dehydrogenase
MGLVVDTGRTLAVPTPQGSALLQVLVAACAAGLGDKDWSELVTAAERQGDVALRWNTE